MLLAIFTSGYGADPIKRELVRVRIRVRVECLSGVLGRSPMNNIQGMLGLGHS